MTGWHRHRHRPGPELPADTANEGWGLLTGHQRGPRSGHTRGLSHGHGHRRGLITASSLLAITQVSRAIEYSSGTGGCDGVAVRNASPALGAAPEAACRAPILDRDRLGGLIREYDQVA